MQNSIQIHFSTKTTTKRTRFRILELNLNDLSKRIYKKKKGFHILFIIRCKNTLLQWNCGKEDRYGAIKYSNL